MTSRARRRTQARDVKRRAEEAPQDPGEFCLVPSCGRLTARASRRGLSIDYCRNHCEALRAHGHLTAKSFRKEALRPYRQAAATWHRRHGQSPRVLEAVKELDWLLATSGRAESANTMRSKPPREKCRIQLAKIREAGKTGGQLLEAVLTSLAIVHDHGPPGCEAFRYIQTAKLAKRLRGASGTHIPSTLYGDSSKYPRAQGAFVRMLGEKLEETVRPLLDGGAVDEVRELVRTGRQG